MTELMRRITMHATLMLSLLMLSNGVFASTHTFESGWSGFTNTGSKQMLRRSGTTPSGGTGPSSAANGTYYAYFETSSGAAYSKGDTAYLQKTGVSTNAMSFYYHMYGSDIGTLAVEVNYQGSWHRIWQADGQKQTSSSSAWAQQTLSLAFYPGTKSIRFVAIADGGYRGDLAIDHVVFFNRGATTLKYRYDELGRVICVEDNINGDRDFEYDKAGNRKQVAVGVCND